MPSVFSRLLSEGPEDHQDDCLNITSPVDLGLSDTDTRSLESEEEEGEGEEESQCTNSTNLKLNLADRLE